MSRYLGPRLRILRRLGPLSGLRQNTKTIRKNSPGQHGKEIGKQKIGAYNLRLLEKQKLRYNYGVTERQLSNYVKKARKIKGATGLKLLQMLEMRLDTLAFRLGWGNSIPAARQLVNHGHVLVNGQKITIPSFICKPGDKLKLKEKLQNNKQVLSELSNCPKFLELDKNKTTGIVKELVSREDFTLSSIDELLIVEYYSRR
jgi:small subunit ribosomal protein S4